MNGDGLTISPLRHHPEFFDNVADRIWQAWWKPHGVPLAYISGRLREGMTAAPLPQAFVAHEAGVFAGTASVIASDMDERPQYSPWVAAVWVEPEFRSRGLAPRLIARAVDHALSSGAPRVYLTARPPLRGFYERQGWKVIEEGVSDLDLIVFARDSRMAVSC